MKNIVGQILVLVILAAVPQPSSAQWSKIDNGLIPSTVKALTVAGPYLFAGTTGNGVYRSSNNGTTWTAVNNGLTDMSVTKLAVLGTQIVLGTSNSGIFRSTDYGANWSSVFTDPHIGEVTDLVSHGSMMYASMISQFVVSADSGSNWTSIAPPYVINMRAIAFLDSTIYVATWANGVHASTDGGGSWHDSSSGIVNSYNDVIASDGTNLYTNPDGTIYRSTNGGLNWTYSSDAAIDGTVIGAAHDSVAIYAATTSNGVYRSSNTGITWSQFKTGLVNVTIKTIIVSESSMYIGTTNGGIYTCSPYVSLTASKYWMGSSGGGDGTSWSDALNWWPNSVPAATDSVELNNSIVSTTYTVTLPSGATNTTVGNITITPDSGKTITLLLPSGNTATPALTLGNGQGTAYDFRLNSGALFKNQSGATSGTTITFANSTDSILIMNGARWLHTATAGTVGVSNKLSRFTAGAETGIFEFDMPGITNATVQSNNIYYGTLVLSSTAAGGSKKYIRAGSSAMTVQGDFIINSGVRDSSVMTGTAFISGNFVNNGVQGFAATNTQPYTFKGTSEQTISGTGVINFNSGATINTGSTVRLMKNISIATAKTITVNGTLDLDTFTVSGTGSVSVSSGKVKTKYTTGLIGAMPVSGSVSIAGQIEFNGSSAQVTGTNLPTTIGTMTINNASGVSLSKSTTISTLLNFTNGNLITDAFTLTLGTSGSIAGEDAGKYLLGNLSIGKSVGTGASTFGNIGVSLNAGGGDNLGFVTVTRVTGAGGIVTAAGNTGIARKWTISNSFPPVNGRDITFSWISSDDNSKNISSGAVNKSTNSGSTWSPVSAGNYSTRSALVSGETSFGMYTIGEESAPLPVEMVTFTASSVRLNTNLKWKTATEVNNRGFEVERKELNHRIIGTLNQSTDGSMDQWKTISFNEGHGTTNAPNEYFFVDKNLKTGKYVYRLKQIDRNGKFRYSQEVETEVGNVPKVFSLEQNYPNPFNPSTTIGFTLQVSGLTTLKIYDAIGREAATLVNENLEAGVYHQKTFDASRLSSGIYFARLSSGDKVSMKKMLLIK